MSKILVLNTGLNGEQSNSNKFTQMYLDIRKSSGLKDEVSVRDLHDEQLPHLSAQEMQAWMTPAEQQTAQQQQLASLSDELIDELMAHDIIVIGMPMYNLGVPSTFKAYIDRIARAGKTFSYSENGPQGLVKNTKVVVLAARGGMYQGTPMDTQTGFIKGIYGMMGVSDIDFIYAEGLNMGEEIAEKAWIAANEQLEQTV
ncbi:FMN-dependent NADH-azoreductase [Thalassomonas haliotis]|uniref:FMN dependent NADH:quinone oxidoreductase n=1 Tax=Thalassomonas haliotis TaxID=485448 RepID=A0ABY7V897_9GAMM|nr:NAD(P)H-dependent oxidoreductase [Thalassomonas haliotis]WDE09592.1 NAD(P)H-dependent oxidoreductase [Thalassomonas haliotis]